MGQITAKMRSTTSGFSWWCPACEEGHPLPSKKGWTFDGNLNDPTFTPSFKHSSKQIVRVNGVWTGEWVRDKDGNTIDSCCHYIITAGQVAYCGDCTHSFAGRTIPMPNLPPHMRDGFVLTGDSA